MKFLIIDDHPLVRASMSALLAQHFPKVRLVERSNFESAATEFKETCPDLILLDLTLPGISGFEAIEHILKMYPDARILIISGSTNPIDIKKSLAAGAKGFLGKSESTEEILATIKAVLRGKALRKPSLNMDSQKVVVTDAITELDMDILKLIYAGKRNKEIAAELGMSEPTVKMRCRHLYHILGANNRNQAIKEALRLGIL